MYKLNFLSLIILLLFNSHNLYSKTMFLKCDNFFFKISEPVVGFKKAYLIEEGKWSKVKEFEVTDNNYILKNIYPNQNKCNNDECRVSINLKKNHEESSYLSYKSIVSNKFCNLDGGSKCYKRKIGQNLESGYCSKIKIQDINLE